MRALMCFHSFNCCAIEFLPPLECMLFSMFLQISLIIYDISYIIELQKRLFEQRGELIMSKNFRDTLNERLKDEKFKAEYDALEPEYQLINAILDSQKETQA